jgi:small subunit ribosomal protein S8
MSRTDLIADMLTQIRNACRAKKETVDLPFSKIGEGILNILKKEKYIENYRFLEDKKQGVLRVYLKYLEDQRSAITDLKRISKPGLRRYIKKDEIKPVLDGYGIAIISSSKGLLTDKEARRLGVGGEVICHVW